MAEPESPARMDSEEEDQISEFPLPGDQLAEDKTPLSGTREIGEVSPPPDKEMSSPAEASDIPPVAPLP
ncbi:MAG: hypothetical protein R3351_08740, partial [Nitrospirales bacterium]|nr:hypothetical protein [Nitrospirales bacterium]